MKEVFIFSEVGKDSEGIVLGLTSKSRTMVVTVDRATAARLINQLRRTLDSDGR